MKNIKKWLVGAFALITLISLTACQTNTPKNEEKKLVNSEEKVVTAAKAYVQGFVQGDESKYNEYYGSDAFDKKIDKQIDEMYNNKSQAPTADVKELLKEMVIASKKLYAKAEVVSYTKKDDKTVSVKVKAVSTKISDVQAWSEQKTKEYTKRISSGDTSAAEAMKKMPIELFEAMISGEIPTTLDSEKSFDLEFSETDGKYEVKNENFMLITNYFYSQK